MHFVGGPIDGEMHEWNDPPRELWFPGQPPPGSSLANPDSPLPIEPLVYRRRDGVVAGEAVYELVP